MSTMSTPSQLIVDAQIQAIVNQLGGSFTLPAKQNRQRMIIEVTSMEKGGKTHFSFTAPGPIAYQYADVGHDGVIQKFPKKLIIPAGYKMPIPLGMKGPAAAVIADPVWDKVKTDYRNTLKHPTLRTTVWDTGTEFWRYEQLARFGQVSQVPQMLREIANQEFSDLVREAYDYNKNLIILHRMKKRYMAKAGTTGDKMSDSYWTGEWDRAGFNDIGYLVQASLFSSFDPVTKDFTMKVVTCRQNPSIVGEVYTNLTFAQFGTEVFPGTSIADWE